MIESIAKRWVEALRSGAFKQTTGRLEDKNGSNCCLGVLSTLAMAEGICDYQPHDLGNYDPKFDGECEFTPTSVADWAGLQSSQGKLYLHDSSGELVCTTLAELNDGEFDEGQKFNFKKIADIIEKNWKQL